MEQSIFNQIMETVQNNVEKYGHRNIYHLSKKDQEQAIEVMFEDGHTGYLLNREAPKKAKVYYTEQGKMMHTIWGEEVYFIKNAILRNEQGEELIII